MAVTLSPLAGAGWQFFDNNGIPLSGGLLYSYEAGTSTPLATYTSAYGNVSNANPIVLDAAGRVPNEIWITVGFGYKFVLKDANSVQIATWDNIPSNGYTPFANDASGVAYEQGYSVNAGSFVIGSSYLITSVGTTNFIAIGALTNAVGVYFTATGAGSGTGTALLSRSVQVKLQETVSVKDFGATGNGTTDDSVAIRAAIAAVTTNGGEVYFPAGTYLVTAASGDTSNTAIYVPANVRIYGASQRGTLIIPGANNTVCFRFTGLNGGIENLQINNPNAYTNVSGIRLCPIDENQTTIHTDTEFNEVTNVSIRNLQEGITLKCGPRISTGQDSYCYYNTFTNIDIRNTVIGIWLKIPNGGDPGSGVNRNTFISCRVGETGCNTGLKIDAGDTNKFIACSFEGISSGTSPNAVPTAVQIAYNSGTYDSTDNKFYGLEIEGCTRSVDNNNDLTEFYGWNDFTNSYYSPSNRPLAVDFTSSRLFVNSPIKGNSLTLNGGNGAPILLNPNESATQQATITTTAGFSSSYNGTALQNNTALDGTQPNTALPSWFLDIGGAEVGNGVGVSDSFGIHRKPAGSTTWTTYFLGDTTGSWKPGADNTQSLGTASNRWSVVYAGTGTINTSDATQKQQFASLTEAEQATAKAIKGLIKTFKFNNAVAKKGANARTHIGVSAQDVQAAFTANGLNADNYALFCSDTWYTVNGQTHDKNGNQYNSTTPNAIKVTQLGVRYEELLAFVIAAL
jgi:hypothetical protein